MRKSLSVLALAVPLALVACSGTGTSEGPTTQASAAATKAPVAANAHGPVKLVGEALGEVALRPEQRTEIEKLASDAEARHAPIAATRKELVELLATQIEAGKIDRAALKAKLDASSATWESTRTADRAALERLHAILDHDQRAAFVDALEAKLHAKMKEHGPRGRMHELADELKLTDEQRGKIGEALRAQWQSGHAGPPPDFRKGKHALESFKEDTFSVDDFAPPHDMSAMSDHIGAIAEAVVPILTPEQRTLAAAKLRAHGDEMLP